MGKQVEILCEGPSKNNPDRLAGRSPGNKIVLFEGSPRHIGEVFDVHITRSTGFTLYGDPALTEQPGDTAGSLLLAEPAFG